MADRVKAVQLMFNNLLPQELRDYSRGFDLGSLNKLMVEVKKNYPDQFADISHKISNLGRHISYRQGETLSLKDLRPVIDKPKILAEMHKELAEIKKKDPDHYEENRNKIWQQYTNLIQDMTAKAAIAGGNSIGTAVLSGARGKKPQLQAMISAAGTYSDYKGRVVDKYVGNSFAEGVRPADLLAGTPGARSATISTKVSTAKGGDLSKQMFQTVSDMVILARNCGTHNGILLEKDDPSLKGRFLARDVAGFKAGTPIDSKVLHGLRNSKVESVVVRSPLTCQEKDGLCSDCVGYYYNGGKYPKIGEHIGATVSTTIGNPITQGALNQKHQSGMTQGKKEYSGFDTVNQIVQSPEVFKDKAAVAESDGIVEEVKEAAQGGHYIVVGGVEKYIPEGYEILVKPGQSVEAGDQLSDGVVDPEDIIRVAGIGEGRLAYAKNLHKVLESSGFGTDKRNVEVLARGAINHVRIDDPEGMGDHLPDDVTSYNRIQTEYIPPETTKAYKPNKAVGKILQVPALHYSIGTKITPKVARKLEEAGEASIYADDTAPPFVPEMIRMRTSAHMKPDWLASMGTSYLKDQLNIAAVRGDDTNVKENINFGPRLAIGVDFGKTTAETGLF